MQLEGRGRKDKDKDNSSPWAPLESGISCAWAPTIRLGSAGPCC